jgi:erythromycin esterase-like protein
MRIREAALCVAAGVVLAACHATDSTAPEEPGPVRLIGAPWAWSASAQSHVVGVQVGDAHTGSAAVYVTTTTSAFQAPRLFGSPTAVDSTGTLLAQRLRANAYRGRRVRWSGWLRATGLGGPGAALRMRIDGPGVTQGFDDMSGRTVMTTAGWARFAVVLDVPADAIGIELGLSLQGSGDLVADDFALEPVADSVAVTDLLSGPEPSARDSAAQAAYYADAPDAPSNPGFESLGTVLGAAAWLATRATPLTTTQPGADLADLAPLREMVGSARIVGMGEATHGTREFFQLKHRVFQFLVREMGFTHFAIEATWPEANDVNHYLLTGQGDPVRLLSRLYFWTWRTQEVLDLIAWMRQWNTTAPASRRVQFLGFDIQYPGAALDTVAAFIGRVDPDFATYVSGRYQCIAPYRNFGATFSRSWEEYTPLSQSVHDACRRSLQEVFDLLDSRRDRYTQASSAATYANALHSARVVQQFEEMAAGPGIPESARARDRAMAENIQWLMQQAGSSARMMLWAHNGHVASKGVWMGGQLRTAFGDDYLNLGFLFGTGGFNARWWVGDTAGELRAFETSFVPEGSLESVFGALGKPLVLFDARLLAGGGAGSLYLGGPIRMRSIGSVYDPSWAETVYGNAVFPADHQLLLYVRSTTPSTVLPYTP